MRSGIFLLLGSNQGQAEENLLKARQLLTERVGNIIRASSVYFTAAWGNTDQPDFFNQVLEISTKFPPEMLLEHVLEIEKDLGRVRKEKWGPRIIDIDILLYHDRIINTPSLSIPHPGIADRRFTLVPLDEIASELIHPVLHKSTRKLLEECKDQSAVKKTAIRYS
jgi:2-amino-4-hydroxy-6-hydroxymethyldihydropteridine diphosphokinase